MRRGHFAFTVDEFIDIWDWEGEYGEWGDSVHEKDRSCIEWSSWIRFIFQKVEQLAINGSGPEIDDDNKVSELHILEE